VEYFLFTYPNCSKCDAMKDALGEVELEGKEFNLVAKESKLKIRDFLRIVKRDDKGAIIIPTLVFQEGDEVLAVLNSREELEDWLKSRD